jgi:hypothetical protein
MGLARADLTARARDYLEMSARSGEPRAGDEVIVLAEPALAEDLAALFTVRGR